MTSDEAAALKVGDKVFHGDEIVVVDRRTATQIVLSNGTRVNKRGNIIGASIWSRFGVSVWSAEREAEILQQRRRRRKINRLHRVVWDRLPDDTLTAIVALLPPEVA